MTKARKAQDTPEKTVNLSLYEIMGVERNASESEMKKAYRVRALQSHPDKNPSSEAKENFQKLQAAYNILKNADSRKLYDETGFVDGEGFDKAADFFRTKFGRISEQDIVDFSGKYKGSDDEKKDVREYYEKNDGDVCDLLEWIPLSEPGEVDRFIRIIDELIESGEVTKNPLYSSSLLKLKKNAVRMEKEKIKFTKHHSGPQGDFLELSLAIQEKRKQLGESFLDDLAAKYSNSTENKKKKPKK